MSTQRQCSGQPSQGQLFFQNMFSDLWCDQADGAQHLPTATGLHSRHAGVPGGRQIDSELMPFSESLFEVFLCSP